MDQRNVILVINKTRFQLLVERFNTINQAKFYIEHSGGDFSDYVKENEQFTRSLNAVQTVLSRNYRYKIVERKFLTNYIFAEDDIVVILGQDGLVANVAKYATDLPIIAVNPDVDRFDGQLLPFNCDNFETALKKTCQHEATIQRVSMAEAVTNDRQRILAFNDLFIGPKSHLSARYSIEFKKHIERQSSSGIIVSTGAGSTGWLSSLINMHDGIARMFGLLSGEQRHTFTLSPESEQLMFIVREPFESKYSSVGLCGGAIDKDEELILESFMPTGGVIFSDGIENDFLTFNAGTTATIRLASEKALLVK